MSHKGRLDILKWIKESQICIKNKSPDALATIEKILDNKEHLASLKKFIEELSESNSYDENEYLNIGESLTEIFYFFSEYHESSCSKLPLTYLIDQMTVFGSSYIYHAKNFESVCVRLTKLRERVLQKSKEQEKKKKDQENDEIFQRRITFRESPILSRKESELFSDKLSADIFPHKIKGTYGSWEIYANNMFFLLKEDFMMDLRAAMKVFKTLGIENRSKEIQQSIYLYERIKIKDLFFNKGGTFLSVAVSPHQAGKKMPKINWGNTKRLLTGSLVLICNKDFDYIMFATISEKPKERVMNRTYERTGFVDISVQIKPEEEEEFLYQEYLDLEHFSENLILIETKNYFESYSHFLDRIKSMSIERLPFGKFIIEGKKGIPPPPKYIEYTSDEYILDLCMNNKRNPLQRQKHRVNVLGAWPGYVRDTLDDFQLAALKNILTRQISIVQGPPGTGKTYVGALAVKILLENKHIGVGPIAKRFSGPIIIICQTNHALDQFLMHISQFTESIIRVGGRSKQAELMQYSLFNKRKNAQRKNISEFYDFKQNILELNNLIYSGIDAGLRNKIIQDFFSFYYSFRDVYRLRSGDKMRLSAFKNNMNIQLQNEIIEIWCSEYREKLRNFRTKIANMLMEKRIFKKDEIIFNATERQALSPTDLMKLLNMDISNEMLSELMENQNPEVKEQNDSNNVQAAPKGGPAQQVPVNPEDDRDDEDMLDDIYVEENRRLENQQEIDWILRERLAMNGLMDEYNIENLIELIKKNAVNSWALPFWCGGLISSYLKTRMSENLPVDEINRRMRLHTRKNAVIQERETEIDLEILKTADIVGMTLTGSAKYSRYLEGLKSEIIIIEEAAEVLECQNIAIFTEYLHHLILIGDHKQLRPKCFNFELERKFNMNISLFERLLNNEIDYVWLQQQRRMRPEIADFVRRVIYGGNYTDHENVSDYKNVKGMKNNVYFINHSFLEESLEHLSSSFNTHEVKFLVKLAKYLVNQGYRPEEITILTFYLGQMFKLRTEAQKETSLRGIIITTVDNYQGEENEIILLSLVRSNNIGKLGFTREANRLCVALSRAKIGMYVIGNVNFLSRNDKNWRKIEEIAVEKNLIGEELTLSCEKHKKEIPVRSPNDFNSERGGVCKENCNERKICGHICNLKCHMFDHNSIDCEVLVIADLQCGHSVEKKCSEKEPLCKEIVQRILHCGHITEVACFDEDPNCDEECLKVFQCGHKCEKTCGFDCSKIGCCKKVEKTLVCGHKAEERCGEPDHETKRKAKCQKKCEAKLSCGHLCQGTCYSCLEGTIHSLCMEKVIKKLPCGHEVLTKCCKPKIFSKICNEECGKIEEAPGSSSIKQNIYSECVSLLTSISELQSSEETKAIENHSLYKSIKKSLEEINNLRVNLRNFKDLHSLYKDLVKIYNFILVFPLVNKMKSQISRFLSLSDMDIKFEKHLELLWDLIKDEDKLPTEETRDQIEEKLACLHAYFSNGQNEIYLEEISINSSFSFKKPLLINKELIKQLLKGHQITFVRDLTVEVKQVEVREEKKQSEAIKNRENQEKHENFEGNKIKQAIESNSKEKPSQFENPAVNNSLNQQVPENKLEPEKPQLFVSEILKPEKSEKLLEKEYDEGVSPSINPKGSNSGGFNNPKILRADQEDMGVDSEEWVVSKFGDSLRKKNDRKQPAGANKRNQKRDFGRKNQEDNSSILGIPFDKGVETLHDYTANESGLYQTRINYSSRDQFSNEDYLNFIKPGILEEIKKPYEPETKPKPIGRESILSWPPRNNEGDRPNFESTGYYNKYQSQSRPYRREEENEKYLPYPQLNNKYEYKPPEYNHPHKQYNHRQFSGYSHQEPKNWPNKRNKPYDKFEKRIPEKPLDPNEFSKKVDELVKKLEKK